MDLELELRKRHAALFAGLCRSRWSRWCRCRSCSATGSDGLEGIGERHPSGSGSPPACFVTLARRLGVRVARRAAACGAELDASDAAARYGVGSLVNSFAPASSARAVRLALYARGCTARAGSGRPAASARRSAPRALFWLGARVAIGVGSGALPRWPLAAAPARRRVAAARRLARARLAPGPPLRARSRRVPRARQLPARRGALAGWTGLAMAARLAAAAALAAAFGLDSRSRSRSWSSRGRARRRSCRSRPGTSASRARRSRSRSRPGRRPDVRAVGRDRLQRRRDARVARVRRRQRSTSPAAARPAGAAPRRGLHGLRPRSARLPRARASPFGATVTLPRVSVGRTRGPRRRAVRVAQEARRLERVVACASGSSRPMKRRRAAARAAEARRDDRHPDLAGEPLVDGRAEDDVRVVGRGLADDLGGLVDLEQRQVVAAGDREQDAARADDLGVDQRRAQRRSAACARGSRRSRSRCPSAPSRRRT